MAKYFGQSYFFSFVGLFLAASIGFFSGGVIGAMQTVFITFVLAILEISLSFDNAIVNAIVLKKMTPIWQRRFLTWGMLVAVFGMRLIFPLAIVSVIGKINPIEALRLALFHPQDYAEMMLASHLQVSAFGGAFLLLVGLKYFYDENKIQHWISFIESPVAKLGRFESIEIGVTLSILVSLSYFINDLEKIKFLVSGLFGIILFVIIDGIGAWLEFPEDDKKDFNKISAGMFVYLEVLDASFSFDGVIGSFAISQNLFIILIGLSIGAFFVRSLTILLVEKETLSQFVFLEHGAFYAILSLALMMLVDPFTHIPEWVTGLCGALIICFSFIWSIKFAPPEKI